MSAVSDIDVQLAEAETALEAAFDPIQVSALAGKIVELKAARTAAQAAAVTPGTIPATPAQVAPAPAMSPAPAAPAPYVPAPAPAAAAPAVKVVAPSAPPVTRVMSTAGPPPVNISGLRPSLRPTRN